MLKKSIMKNKEIKLNQYGKWIMAIAILVSAFFALSAFYRWNYIDLMSPRTHDWMSASTIKFVNNWLQEGILELKFMMLENPASIEFESLASRDIYVSYLPTCLLPVYIICKTLGISATPAIVRYVNLSNHYALTLILSFSAFYILRKSKYSYFTAFIFAGITGLAASFISGAYYFMEFSYWSDMAVLPYFALILMLEIYSFNMQNNKFKGIINVIYFTAMLVGCLIDWQMFFVAAVVFLTRLFIRREKFIKTALLSVLPVLIASATFLFYIKSCGVELSSVLDKLMTRTGIIEEVEFTKSLTFLRRFLSFNMALSLSKIGTVIMLIGIIGFIFYSLFYILHKEKSDRQNYYLNILVISFLPCIMQIIIFNDHSYGHYFSALKFIVPLLVSTFTVLPLFIIYYYKIHDRKDLVVKLKNSIGKIKIKGNWYELPNKIFIIPIILAVLMMSFSCSLIKTREVPNQYMHQVKDVDYNWDYYYEKFLSANMDYYDYVISPHYLIPANDPVQLSYSKKRVYNAVTLDETTKLIESENLPDTAIINIFTIDKHMKNLDSEYKALLLKASDFVSLTDFYVFKFTLNEYFEALNSITDEDIKNSEGLLDIDINP